jgi:hypothetical protein
MKSFEEVREAFGNSCGMKQEPDFDIALLSGFGKVGG